MYCAICGRPAQTLLSVKDVPALQNVLAETREGAKRVPRVDATAVWCMACEHISISKTGSTIGFDQAYNNRVEGSAIVRSLYRNIADQIEALASDKKANIIEIGCGRGELLQELFTRGFQNIIGYDPAAPSSLSNLIVQDYWRPSESMSKFDFVVLRHTLEELSRPYDFLLDIKSIVHRDSKIYLEITNNEKSYFDCDIFTIYPEYYNIFSVRSIGELLFRAGYAVSKVDSCLGGSWLGIWATLRHPTISDASDLISRLRERIVKLPRPVVLWGAGGRGCNILNFCSLSTDDILAVVDSDPAKWGKYIAGSAHPIFAPAELTHIAPRSVLVANAAYISEIRGGVPAGVEVHSIQELLRNIE